MGIVFINQRRSETAGEARVLCTGTTSRSTRKVGG